MFYSKEKRNSVSEGERKRSDAAKRGKPGHVGRDPVRQEKRPDKAAYEARKRT